MAFDFFDGVLEGSTSTGNAALLVAGPPSGYRAFGDVLAIGDTTIVEVVGTSGLALGKRESLIVTRSAASTLTPAVVLESTEAANAKINWPAGNKVIKCAPVAALFKAIVAGHRATARPPWVRSGQTWSKIVSATREEVYLYDGAQDILVLVVDPTNNTVLSVDYVGPNVASAATVDLAAQRAKSITITGTNGITSFGSPAAGLRFRLTFAGILTITNSANVKVVGGANWTTAAGDMADVWSAGGGVVVVVPERVNGKATVPPSFAETTGSVAAGQLPIAAQSDQESGSSLVVLVTPGRQHYHPAHPKLFFNYNQSGTPSLRRSHNVSSMTDSGTGLADCNIATAMSDTTYALAGWARDDDGTAPLMTLSASSGDTKTVSAFRVVTFDGSSVNDSPEVDVIMLGDQ